MLSEKGTKKLLGLKEKGENYLVALQFLLSVPELAYTQVWLELSVSLFRVWWIEYKYTFGVEAQYLLTDLSCITALLRS